MTLEGTFIQGYPVCHLQQNVKCDSFGYLKMSTFQGPDKAVIVIGNDEKYIHPEITGCYVDDEYIKGYSYNLQGATLRLMMPVRAESDDITHYTCSRTLSNNQSNQRYGAWKQEASVQEPTTLALLKCFLSVFSSVSLICRGLSYAIRYTHNYATSVSIFLYRTT